MNDIATNERNKLLVTNLSCLMSIQILGKPVTALDPVSFVKTWLRGHRDANDTRVKNSVARNYLLNEEELWKLA